MKKTVRMFVFVVVLAVALGITAYAIEDSRRMSYKWSEYSGTCALTAEPKEVYASMSVTVDAPGTTYLGAEFKMEGTAYFVNSEGTGLLEDQPLDDSRDLPGSVGASDSIGVSATYRNYISVMANCTYSIPLTGREMTLSV